LISCSEFRKIQKKGDWKQKYDAALQYYEEEEYYKASVLLEDILPIIRGTEFAEKAEYVYAYSYFHQGQHILSAHYFQNFYRTFSRSDFAEEAMYMHAYSLYLDSPDYNLDQTSTVEAINAMQLFLNRFPQSHFRQDASDIIQDLQVKLEKKSYDNSTHYYRLERFKAAVVAFENFLTDFPDSELVEEVAYMQVDAQYRLALRSIYSKKRERFQKALDYYQEYIDDYPEGEYVKDAQKIFDDSRDELAKIVRLEQLSDNSIN
jgi:outer membrane protein assembly factor BamD